MLCDDCTCQTISWLFGAERHNDTAIDITMQPQACTRVKLHWSVCCHGFRHCLLCRWLVVARGHGFHQLLRLLHQLLCFSFSFLSSKAGSSLSTGGRQAMNFPMSVWTCFRACSDARLARSTRCRKSCRSGQLPVRHSRLRAWSALCEHAAAIACAAAMFDMHVSGWLAGLYMLVCRQD